MNRKTNIQPILNYQLLEAILMKQSQVYEFYVALIYSPYISNLYKFLF